MQYQQKTLYSADSISKAVSNMINEVRYIVNQSKTTEIHFYACLSNPSAFPRHIKDLLLLSNAKIHQNDNGFDWTASTRWIDFPPSEQATQRELGRSESMLWIFDSSNINAMEALLVVFQHWFSHFSWKNIKARFARTKKWIIVQRGAKNLSTPFGFDSIKGTSRNVDSERESTKTNQNSFVLKAKTFHVWTVWNWIKDSDREGDKARISNPRSETSQNRIVNALTKEDLLAITRTIRKPC